MFKSRIPARSLIFAPMKSRISFFFSMAAFWLVLFVLSRWIFLMYHYSESQQLELIDFGMIFFLGLRMDAAMAAYWLIPTGLLLTFSSLFSSRVAAMIHHIFVYALLLLTCVVVVVDLELYRHWGFRMNTTPLFYAGKEALGSVSIAAIVSLSLIFVIVAGAFSYFYFQFIRYRYILLDQLGLTKMLLMFLMTAALFIPIRSSFDVAPLNTGMVYYHKTKNFPNHAGINVVWNFLKSVQRDNTVRYPNNFYTGEKPSFYQPLSDSTTERVVAPKPNVIVIILESFTSKIIEPLGGQPGITPNLSALSKEGILFTNMYASGDRTDKGLVSILSSYPAQPRSSIIKYPEKTQSLSFLPKQMKKLGYRTSFTYGGDTGFANMASYLTMAGFDHITQDIDFDGSLRGSKWGVPDHYVFDQLLTEIDSASSPFFKVMLSLSSHEPFEVPMEPVFEGADEGTRFLNSCFYTDQSLGNFIQTAKTKSWWNNTLIIITADHGHRFPNPSELKDKERFKIPMLWLGGALNKQPHTIDLVASQTDIGATLLGQLTTGRNPFAFGKNVFDRTSKSFAVYIFNNGYGLVLPNSESVFDFDLNGFLKKEGTDNDTQFGEAYIQTLFDDYNQR